MYYVYIVRSLKNNKHYIGYTNNLKRRLVEHNQGKSLSVRNRGPFVLMYSEEYVMKTDAILREQQIKSYKSGLAFKKLLNKSSTLSSSLV